MDIVPFLTLKSRLGVIQGNCEWHNSIDRMHASFYWCSVWPCLVPCSKILTCCYLDKKLSPSFDDNRRVHKLDLIDPYVPYRSRLKNRS